MIGQTPEVVQKTPDILDCSNFVDFWISWERGNITVGNGTLLNEGVFMYYDDSAAPHVVTSVSFTGEAETVEADWEFSRDSGETKAPM